MSRYLAQIVTSFDSMDWRACVLLADVEHFWSEWRSSIERSRELRMHDCRKSSILSSHCEIRSECATRTLYTRSAILLRKSHFR